MFTLDQTRAQDLSSLNVPYFQWTPPRAPTESKARLAAALGMSSALFPEKGILEWVGCAYVGVRGGHRCSVGLGLSGKVRQLMPSPRRPQILTAFS